MEFMLVVFVFVIIAIVSSAVRAANNESQLAQWARDNHFAIVRSERCLFLKGPFFFNRKNQSVHRVSVLDENKRPRSAYIRLTRSFLFGNKTEVRWQD